jgi:hypothetical protein
MIVETFFLTLGLMLLSIGGLAVGMLSGRSSIRGFCGSLSCTEGMECGACSRRAGKGEET